MSPGLISGSGEDGCLDSGVGVEEWGLMGCYNPVEDVSTYKGCERCQPAAPCCQLARPVLHIECLSRSAHRAPWAPFGVSEPVNHLCSRSNLPTLV